MSASQLYKVLWHFVDGNKKPISEVFQDHVVATAGDENTLRTVLGTNNSKTRNGATIQFLSIANSGPAALA